MKILGAVCWGDNVSEFYSTQRVFDGWCAGWPLHDKRHPDNPENVYYVYWNDDRWVKNWNWLDNKWNDNNRVLRRKSLYSPSFSVGGVVFLNKASHLPSILPIPISFCESCAYLFTVNPFASHNKVTKNFVLSSLRLMSSKIICLFSRFENCAAKVASNNSINKLSIFAPSVYLVSLGKF